jgi:hypothetical protein
MVAPEDKVLSRDAREESRPAARTPGHSLRNPLWEKPMQDRQITRRDRFMAQRCIECTVCTRARGKQRGFAFWFVNRIEGGICPFCRAYEKVYGRKAHEPGEV